MTVDILTSPVLLTDDSQYRTPEWYEARRLGITATDIAKICGLHAYGSAWEVYQDKIGDPLPDDAGEAAELGNLLEPIVADMWAKRKNRRIVPSGLYANGARSWMCATPDRLVLKKDVETEDWRPYWGDIDGPLEVKTALGWAHLDWADEGQVPDAHMCQVQWQMAVLGTGRAWIAALAGPSLKTYTIERDQGYIDDLITVAEQFREQVGNRIPPAPDGSDRLAKLLTKRWQPDPDKTVVLDPAAYGPLRDAYLEAGARESQAKKDKTAAGNAIRLLLGDAEAAVIDDVPVATWKSGTRASYTVAPTTTRTLNVKKPKKATS